MGVTYTVTATCDGVDDFFGTPVDCPVSESLDPNRNQPYVELLGLGWSTDIEGHDQTVYCPRHTKERVDAKTRLGT